MRWLEIIHFRTTRSHLERLLEDLSGSIEAAEQDRTLTALRVYRHPRLDAEVVIHMHWKGQKPQTLESTLGLRLARLNDEYGSPNHSVWVALPESKKGRGEPSGPWPDVSG